MDALDESAVVLGHVEGTLKASEHTLLLLCSHGIELGVQVGEVFVEVHGGSFLEDGLLIWTRHERRFDRDGDRRIHVGLTFPLGFMLAAGLIIKCCVPLPPENLPFRSFFAHLACLGPAEVSNNASVFQGHSYLRSSAE